MKKLLFVLPFGLFAMACSETPQSQEETTPVEAVDLADNEAAYQENEEAVYPYFAGEEFDPSIAISQEELIEVVKNFEGGKKEIAFQSEIIDNCEKKGCWMNVAAGNEKIRVRFKDYEFFVPLDSKGHRTTLNGVLFYDTLTVEQLRHYAMDANASQDSINNITEPIITLSYEATGVFVQ